MAAKKKNRLTLYIFIGMGIGLLVGALFPDFGSKLQPLSDIFLRLIKSIIAPLIFARKQIEQIKAEKEKK